MKAPRLPRRNRKIIPSEATPPDLARALYEEYITKLRERGLRVATGEFGAMMLVEIQNNGPVTLLLDSKRGSDVSHYSYGAPTSISALAF